MFTVSVFRSLTQDNLVILELVCDAYISFMMEWLNNIAGSFGPNNLLVYWSDHHTH